MLSRIFSFATKGVEGVLIEVEVELCNKSTPNFIIVGLPDTTVREARDRVKSAMQNSGYKFPRGRILISLAPGDIKKQGSQYDLPIALALLSASEQIPSFCTLGTGFAGELGLDGSLRPIRGTILMSEVMHQKGIDRICVPNQNAKEASISKLVEVFPLKNLHDVVKLLLEEGSIQPYSHNFDIDNLKEDIDYGDVSGQEYSKRAMLISAAGFHHCIMSGPPGSGKTMLARRITTILPRLSQNQAIETTRIYSITGMFNAYENLIFFPPFRSPHHTISNAGMAGGGCNPRPGELSLAHNGVLFLDELAEFSRSALEVLRQPLESGHITIARARETLTFPASFLLIAAMNPCPCGYLGDCVKMCKCYEKDILQYRKKISGPLLDRFDIQITVPRIFYQDIVQKKIGINSFQMSELVQKARLVQEKRFHGLKIKVNGQMSVRMVEKYCQLEKDAEKLLELAMNQKGFSVRAYHKILKIARTIADLEESENIQAKHISEAVQYRALDSKL